MPFKPGVSGNPNGRPKGKNLRAENTEEFFENNIDRINSCMSSLIDFCLAGDKKCCIEVKNVFFTRPKTEISIGNEENEASQDAKLIPQEVWINVRNVLEEARQKALKERENE